MEKQTWDCRGEEHVGEERSSVNRGPYAYLCPPCIGLKSRRAREMRERGGALTGGGGITPRDAPVVTGLVSYEAKAKELVPAGKTLDKAMRKVRRHKETGKEMVAKHARNGEGIQRELAAAVRGWNEKLDGLKMGGQS